MENEIKSLCSRIENNIQDLKLKNSFDDYDSLEFNLFDLNTKLSDYEYQYEKMKLENSIEWSKEFNRERQIQKSDASTERAIELLLEEKIFTEKSQKNKVEMYNKLQKGYIRIAEHVKSKFIREMGEEKRQRLIESQQQKF